MCFPLHHKTDKQRKKHDHASCGTRALSRKARSKLDAIRKRSNNFSILLLSIFFEMFLCVLRWFLTVFWRHSRRPKRLSTFSMTLHIFFSLQPSVQPTKYHYYPHNQQPYFLPECAIQQVRNDIKIFQFNFD